MPYQTAINSSQRLTQVRILTVAKCNTVAYTRNWPDLLADIRTVIGYQTLVRPILDGGGHVDVYRYEAPTRRLPITAEYPSASVRWCECGGMFHRIYCRLRRGGKATWCEMGWLCNKCRTIYLEVAPR